MLVERGGRVDVWGGVYVVPRRNITRLQRIGATLTIRQNRT